MASYAGTWPGLPGGPDALAVIHQKLLNHGYVLKSVGSRHLRDEVTRQGGPLEPAVVVNVGVQSLAALAYLHERHLIHRDISPDNLMITRDKNGTPLVKLIDLGIAKSLEETGVSAYNGALAQLQSPDLMNSLASIAQVEARHAAAIRMKNGGQPTSSAFDQPFSQAQALAALKPYVK